MQGKHLIHGIFYPKKELGFSKLLREGAVLEIKEGAGAAFEIDAPIGVRQ